MEPNDLNEPNKPNKTNEPNEPGLPHDLHGRLDLLRAAALQAERATGAEEATPELARRHIAIRLATIVVGFAVLLLGLIMMILPGPGIVGILAGLGILSRELPWAERVIEYVKKRSKVDQLKQQPKWIQVTMWILTIAGMVASVVFLLKR